MELKNLRGNFEKLPKEQADAILNIIEYKTEQDMKEVISEIRSTKWIIGVAFTILTVLIAILALRK